MDNQTPDNIRELITKALKGEISREENDLLDLWYDQALPEKVLWRGPETNANDLRNKLFSEIEKKIKVPVTKIPFYRTVLFRVAASLLLVAGTAFYFIANIGSMNEQIIAVHESGVKKVILPDHSIVWLKGNSTLSYPEHFDDATRTVELEGEALFEVTKDKDHPFIVKTGNYATRVLGTSFNLDTREKNYKLIVLTGKVQVNELNPVNKTQKVLAVVLPNQRFDKQPLKSGTVSAPEDTEKVAVMSGTEYPMHFAHTPFPVIMERIEKKFNISFAKSDYSIYGTCTITADLTDQSLINSLEILSAAMGATYKIENNIISIGGGGCR